MFLYFLFIFIMNGWIVKSLRLYTDLTLWKQFFSFNVEAYLVETLYWTYLIQTLRVGAVPVLKRRLRLYP